MIRIDERIIDLKSGSYDCTQLDGDEKPTNAQNYAWLAGVSSMEWHVSEIYQC
jgi:hypothetical protein